MTTTAVPADTVSDITARGPLSAALLHRLTGEDAPDLRDRAASALAPCDDIVRDDDVQLSLFLLYASAYGSLPELDASLEWDPELISVRQSLEAAFEQALRARVPAPELPEATVNAVGRALFALAEADTGPSLSRYLAKKATPEQAT